MDSPGAPHIPVNEGRHPSYGSDNSTVCGNDFEKDIESQQMKTKERSFSTIFGMGSPVGSNLADIDDDELAEPEEEEKTADVSAIDRERSTSMECTQRDVGARTNYHQQSTPIPLATRASPPS